MASANVTLPGSQGKLFEADATSRLATLLVSGGRVTNTARNNRTAWINEGGGTAAADDGVSVPIGPGASHQLDITCQSFGFMAVGGAEFLLYTRG